MNSATNACNVNNNGNANNNGASNSNGVRPISARKAGLEQLRRPQEGKEGLSCRFSVMVSGRAQTERVTPASGHGR